MKDLITTIGSILILSVFLMQFCSNQVLASKFLIADSIIDKIESLEDKEIDIKKSQIADCFECDMGDIKVTKKENKLVVEAPIYDVVACGKFLGITRAENKCVYTREIALK